MVRNPSCSASGRRRRLSGPEAGVLIVIIVVAALLARAGLSAASVAVLLTEAVALGVGFVRRLRGAPVGRPGCAEV
ncbi:hypothetical protein [Streptomyces naphthomycinicus]|uniref:hypothetical protein n=1 Tax=Streptomyces naphthomycinicus TaxID=2872625 RepID=UPI001CEC5F3D|nr:hypothetical protein [Streptomyces sp. TML10]